MKGAAPKTAKSNAATVRLGMRSRNFAAVPNLKRRNVKAVLWSFLDVIVLDPWRTSRASYIRSTLIVPEFASDPKEVHDG
jgi:hypothetical protein